MKRALAIVALAGLCGITWASSTYGVDVTSPQLCQEQAFEAVEPEEPESSQDGTSAGPGLLQSLEEVINVAVGFLGIERSHDQNLPTSCGKATDNPQRSSDGLADDPGGNGFDK